MRRPPRSRSSGELRREAHRDAGGQGGQGALSGRRVLELADASGAYCGKLMADLGADVIKVERPGGDPSRQIRRSGATRAATTRAFPSYTQIRVSGASRSIRRGPRT